MGRKKLYDRETALAAATDQFWKHGFKATSITDLTTATNMNRKSLYAEFGDKEDLFVEVLKKYGRDRRNDFSMLGDDPAGIDNIERFFAVLVEGVHGSGCLFTMALNENTIIPQKAIHEVEQTMKILKRAFARNLSGQGWSRQVVQQKADFLLATMQGITTLSRGICEKAELQQIAATALGAVECHNHVIQ